MREVLALYESNPAVCAAAGAAPLWISPATPPLLRQVLYNLAVNARRGA